MDAKKRNALVVDLIVLVVYLVVANPALTGIGVHEWLGIAAFVAFVAHAAQHGDWVAETARTAFARPSLGRTGHFVLDALIVVTEDKYQKLAAENRLAEVVAGHCTYEGGYFDVKYKTKAILQASALRASEPTRNAYVKARVLYSADPDIAPLVKKIAAYPEHELDAKIRCFNANLQLNRGYFLRCVPEENAYMRAHLAQEIVYSVYRLILIENRALFPCNRRLEETVRACGKRPANIVELGAKFLSEITAENCEAFVKAFWEQSALPLNDDVSESCSQYVKYYEDWWLEEDPPFPNEW